MKAVSEIERITEEVRAGTRNKPTLLLHCCCAPCAVAVLEALSPYFEITAYYCNPNITDSKEYALRLRELKRICGYYCADVIDEGYSDTLFFEKTRGLENEPEGGKRCRICFFLRLGSTAKRAVSYDYFATTLTTSPLKNAELINQTAGELAELFGSNYLASDFKKKNGYARSVELSRQYGLYRQNYCGCDFSKNHKS